jgi:hypothetical protein
MAKPSYTKSIQENQGSNCYYNLENKSDLPNSEGKQTNKPG